MLSIGVQHLTQLHEFILVLLPELCTLRHLHSSKTSLHVKAWRDVLPVRNLSIAMHKFSIIGRLSITFIEHVIVCCRRFESNTLLWQLCFLHFTIDSRLEFHAKPQLYTQDEKLCATHDHPKVKISGRITRNSPVTKDFVSSNTSSSCPLGFSLQQKTEQHKLCDKAIICTLPSLICHILPTSRPNCSLIFWLVQSTSSN